MSYFSLRANFAIKICLNKKKNSYQRALVWKEKVEFNLLLSQNVIEVVFYWFLNQTTTNCCWRLVFIL